MKPENDEFVLQCLEDALTVLQAGKPVSAGPEARRYAIAITLLEQLIAYVVVFILGRGRA
ncbi:MAG: hypothetical protein KDE47_32855 [Caldilineaceae bacterium]|nr:hypothetical protein [Caldilineaceae bacterium]